METIRQPNSSSRDCLAGRTTGTGSAGPLPASSTSCQDDLGVRHYGAVSKRRPPPGSVIQLPLPDGRFAYGRVYRDAAVCFYRYATRLPSEPPIGLRNFAFCVGVYDDVVASWEVVGVDGFLARGGQRLATRIGSQAPDLRFMADLPPRRK